MAAAGTEWKGWLSEQELRELGSTLSDPEPIRRSRAEALEAFEALPLEPDPTYRRHSNFAGADLRSIEPSQRASPVGAPALPPATIRILHDAAGTHVAVPDALRDAGVTLRTLSEVWEAVGRGETSPLGPLFADDKVTAYARALTNRFFELRIPDRCAYPVRVQEIAVLSEPREALSVRRCISAGKGSRLLLSEELYSSAEAAPDDPQRLYASASDLTLADEATVHVATVHAPDRRAVGLYQRRARVGTAAKLAWLWTGFGGFRTRTRMLTELAGNGSQVEDLQAAYGRDDQAYDSNVQITHQGTDTHGQSITRGLFADRAQGVSRGLVRIEPEARKTLSYLSEHAMLLSRGARSDTIPILEILCRDVKATHSSSVAPVDPEKVFYLESRGIPADRAVRMIGEGFLSHVLERAPLRDLRERLYPFLAARWEGRSLTWGADGYPALAPLEVRDEIAPEEWRFDAKLR